MPEVPSAEAAERRGLWNTTKEDIPLEKGNYVHYIAQSKLTLHTSFWKLPHLYKIKLIGLLDSTKTNKNALICTLMHICKLMHIPSIFNVVFNIIYFLNKIYIKLQIKVYVKT